MFIARKSENIQEDIKRNWSSWNFGQLGFDGTITKYPEHNMVGINCVIAFDHKGILSKWNKRS